MTPSPHRLATFHDPGCAACSPLVASTGILLLAQDPGTTLPGQQLDGTVLLPTGWRLDPYGRQLSLESDLPIRTAWHPSEPLLAVQHAGYRDHRIELVQVNGNQGRVVATLDLPKTWSGFCWSDDGTMLYASGGVEDVIHRFAIRPGSSGTDELPTATAEEPIALGDTRRLDLPAGMCAARDGGLWVCLQRTDKLVHLDASGQPVATVDLPTGSMPFECDRSANGSRVFVSLWGHESVLVVDAESAAPIASIAAGKHPSEMVQSPDGRRLFVSNANENTVTAIDLATLRPAETICSALFPLAPPGSTPNSVSIDPRGNLLLIANADNNNCAVVDVSRPGRSRNLGFIPLGWYPTSIRFAPDGKTVWVANGKGSVGSLANPEGPQPGSKRPRRLDQYIGAMFHGSLSSFTFPSPAELRDLSTRAYACAPLRPTPQVRGTTERPADSPIPAKVGDPSPIRHCIYIIKENRTYDQVFGDLKRGNGDADLCLFPRKVTPNHHAIVDRFVLLDNFYVESEVSADGHEWTMAAYATDFVERTWPVTYGGKGNGPAGGLGYPAEGNFAIATPKNRYLFHIADEAGVSFRTYGEFVRNARRIGEPATATMPVLEGRFDPYFRGYDLSYKDVDRADRFITELRRFESEGEMPQLIVLRLPNDHAAGTRRGFPTPRAMVADNDLALGKVVEAVSKSRFWSQTAIFVVQDDAQNGPDHVDAHRTVAMVASPYAARAGRVVSTMYSTAGMLRTMELILGLPPMSQFDAAATPMYDCFTATPDATPFECQEATWPLDEMNKQTAWGADASEKMDFSREDAADDLLLNEIVWKSVKGADSEMPLPRRAAFVRVHADDDDEDDDEDEDEDEDRSGSKESGRSASDHELERPRTPGRSDG